MISWDPPREMFSFNIPFIDRPILWYGFLFALGCFFAYGLLTLLLRETFPKEEVRPIREKLTTYVFLGTIIGARVGDILFYQDVREYFYNPIAIVQTWNGGLASHGAAIGILIALILFSIKKKIHWATVLDHVVIPVALAGVFIRIGNFINQEILGKATDVPWAIVFEHPFDHSAVLPRHPVQLYEAIFYLALAIFLFVRRDLLKKRGAISGLFLMLLFSFRFLIEFVKEEQSILLSHSFLTMGQWLSIPFIIFGCTLLFRSKETSQHVKM